MSIPRREWGNQAQWAITAPLLAAHILGVPWALPAALMLCALSTAWYLARVRSLRSYRVQIRLGFMAVASAALVPGFEWIAWIPLLGTTAQVLVAYCPMARLLHLMPWNRAESLSYAFAHAVVTRPPGDEGVLTLHRHAGRRASCPS